MPPLIDRRRLLQGTGALLVAFAFPGGGARRALAQATAANTALGGWVRIGSDNRVTLILSQCEIGQGISTTLPAILADELGADWAAVAIENAPATRDYQNPRLHWMFTGNSESIQTFAGVMRQAGATARSLLMEAAVQRWGNVPASDCDAVDGRIVHRPTGRALTFGELAVAAARLPPPAAVTLRAASERRLVGKAQARRDIPAKVDGSAIFGIDFTLPAMAYAAVRQVPVFGGSVAAVDDTAARTMRGVIAVHRIPNGVAVLAEHFWQARSAADALKITFDDGPNGAVSSETLDQQHRDALEGSSWRTITDRKDTGAAPLAADATRLTRDYASPFQAHATMEPMNCTASVTAEGCDVWAPTQGPELTRIVAAKVSGLSEDQIRVHWTYSGGGFGRRLLADFVVQAVLLSKLAARPVKVIWTREEDMTHDFYRPATLTRLSAALETNGYPRRVEARLVSATQLQPVSPAPLPANVDPRCTEGLEDSRYAIADFRLDYCKPTLAVPTSVLRTTGFGPNIFALESFIDELAHAAGADPYQYRRALLARDPRGLKVLDLAAAKSGWAQPLPKGTGRGLAFYEAFDTIMAQIVELRVNPDKSIRLRKVTTVADPGQVFDPGIATSNLEGGVVWGLCSAMKSEITFRQGRVEQTNFDGYDLVHMGETAPVVETHLIEGSEDKIGGLGEVGPTGIPAAVANAIFAATGERLRVLPLSRHGYSFAQG
jgi:isoquinoline 1-oxidoreductase beta subunit